MEDQVQPTHSTDGDEIVKPTHSTDGENKENLEKSEETEPKKYTVKISGEEREVSEEDLIRDYQIKEESFKRMKEATTLLNEVKPWIKKLKSGDFSVLNEIGVSREQLRDFSEKELLAYIKEQEMSPEEREAASLKKERDKYKNQIEQQEKQTEAQKKQHLAAKAAQDIESEFITFFEENKIPMKGAQRAMRQCADIMVNALEHGNDKITVKDAYKFVKGNNQKDLSEFMEREFTTDAESFIKSLPKNVLDGIRDYEVKKVRSSSPMSSDGASNFGKKKGKSSAFRSLMQNEMNKHI